MNKKIRVFYSWQSDLDKKLNNNFIKSAIENAIKKLNKEIELHISLDKDTLGETGSPNITEVIFKKISASDIFICDVSIINNRKLIFQKVKRLTPNPNVLIELGYAVKTLGWNRIICICNVTTGEVEKLPFDIRQNRISVYRLSKTSRKKAEEKKKLTDLISYAIKSIIENYDNIVTEFKQSEISEHDSRVSDKILGICHELTLYKTINSIISNRMTYTRFNLIWDDFLSFQKQEGNRFLSDRLNTAFEDFITKLGEFNLFCSVIMFNEVDDKYQRVAVDGYVCGDRIGVLTTSDNVYLSFEKEWSTH